MSLYVPRLTCCRRLLFIVDVQAFKITRTNFVCPVATVAVVSLRYFTGVVGVPFAMMFFMTKRPKLFVETLGFLQALLGDHLVAVLVLSGWMTLIVRPISPASLAIAATEVGAGMTAIIQRTSECAVSNIFFKLRSLHHRKRPTLKRR